MFRIGFVKDPKELKPKKPQMGRFGMIARRPGMTIEDAKRELNEKMGREIDYVDKEDMDPDELKLLMEQHGIDQEQEKAKKPGILQRIQDAILK